MASSATLATVAAVLVFVVTVSPCAAQGLMRREKTTKFKGASDLQTALAPVLDSAGVSATRLLEIERSIRPTYEAFPKNTMGQLPPQEIFPAIVRSYFAKEHGWLLHGLEPPSVQPKVTEVHEVSVLQSEAPALMAALKELVQTKVGLSLSDVVGTVAALEAMLLNQSMPILQGAYALNQHALSDQVDEEALDDILVSYMLIFRHGGSVNLTNIPKHAAMKARAKRAKDWGELVKFERGVVASHSYGIKGGVYSFDEASKIVREMALNFGKWQNTECLAMKDTLMHMDKQGSGRVLYDDFHAEPKHTGPAFQFTESAEFLRRTGALDETEDGKLQVMIPNYLLGPSNCIAPTKFYSVCCLSECEGLMSDLEVTVQTSQWPASKLLTLVEETPSSSVSAPRALPPAVAEDLNSIALRSEGAVSLHSADFRRWLHSAFPNECPLLTAAENVAEEKELAAAHEWLNAQDTAHVCTRLPEWHEDMVSTDL